MRTVDASVALWCLENGVIGGVIEFTAVCAIGRFPHFWCSRHADHLAQTLRAQVCPQMHGEVQVIVEYSNDEATFFQVAKACTGPVLQASSPNSRRNSVSVLERHRNG